jgi:HD-GYP domain-containing protein (c-di-GMP phosphodiesterase class II)
MKCVSNTFADIITALSFALDLDENRKLYHAWRVAILAHEIAANVPNPPEREHIFYAALLHDTGAIGYSDYVIHSPRYWPKYSVHFLIGHAKRGAAILESIPRLAPAAQMVLDHHEWWDGSGYPNGKRGEEISVGGQVIRIADSAETIIQEVPDLTISQLFWVLKERVGYEYDKKYLDAAMAVFSQNRFLENLYDQEWLAQRIQEIREDFRDDPKNSEEKRTKRDIQAIIRTFAQIIDAKHEYTAGHSERVAMYAYYLGEACGLKKWELETLKLASLLHDVGKIAVPRSILDKPSKLNYEELKVIRAHPAHSKRIVSLISGFEELASIAGHHHEWFNGMGYPNGIRGEEIPFLSRIIAAADAFDAITTERSYQRARSVSTALRELSREAGTHFDPEIIDILQKTFRTELPEFTSFSPLLDNGF